MCHVTLYNSNLKEKKIFCKKIGQSVADVIN